MLKFVWLKGEGRKKKSRQPSARYVVFLTKAAPTDQGGGNGELSLLQIGLFGLDRRTRDRAVRTEHTAIAGFWLQANTASSAVIENLADIRRHPFNGRGSAVRAGDDGH